jgi:hypothetical protein
MGAVTGGRYSRRMRALLPIAALCLLFSPLGSNAASAPDTASTAPAAAPPASASPAAAPPATAADNDAAAKHAKRTACIKKARAKKLVGDEKTAFIKDCTAAP